MAFDIQQQLTRMLASDHIKPILRAQPQELLYQVTGQPAIINPSIFTMTAGKKSLVLLMDPRLPAHISNFPLFLNKRINQNVFNEVHTLDQTFLESLAPRYLMVGNITINFFCFSEPSTGWKRATFICYFVLWMSSECRVRGWEK